jgi:hypothetical protein
MKRHYADFYLACVIAAALAIAAVAKIMGAW